MPLLITCGFPCSGKSTRTAELQKYLKDEKNVSVTVISEHDSKFHRNEMFTDAGKEKEVRATLKSDVQRKLSKDEVVILDAGNYIKGPTMFDFKSPVSSCVTMLAGYRYELHCISKLLKTTHCVIHCDVSVQKAWEWNVARPEADRYTQTVFDELVQRFEPPDSQNRWDSPLITIQAEDDFPYKAVYEALYMKTALRPNKSTQSLPSSSTNYLYDLDRITQETVSLILDAQKTMLPGEAVSLPGVPDKVKLLRTLNTAELARLRRQFMTYSKMHPVESPTRIRSMFVQYLNTALI